MSTTKHEVHRVVNELCAILFEVGECLIEVGGAWPETEEQLAHQLGVLQGISSRLSELDQKVRGLSARLEVVEGVVYAIRCGDVLRLVGEDGPARVLVCQNAPGHTGPHVDDRGGWRVAWDDSGSSWEIEDVEAGP